MEETKIVKAGKMKVTSKEGTNILWESAFDNVRFDFDGVTQEELLKLALSSVKIKAQARAREMSQKGANGYLSTPVSVRELLTVRVAGPQTPEQIVAKLVKSGISKVEILALLSEGYDEK